MIISPVFSLKDVAQSVYITSGTSSSILNKDVTYTITDQRKFHQRKHHMKILSSLYQVHTQDIIFDAVEFQQRYYGNPFVLGDAYLTHFPQRVQWIFVQQMEKITRVNMILKVFTCCRFKWCGRITVLVYQIFDLHTLL